MITCTVCHAENHHLAIVCTQCRGYLQTRVDALDLFATAWRVIDKPKKAFHRISVAQHKNYTYVLSAIAGIALVFFIFWLMNAGEYTSSLINILGAGFTVGPIIGIITVLVYSFILKIMMKVFKADSSFRNVVAVNAYALVPIVISVVLVLPIELMTFGSFFFSKNPSPLMLKPTSYIILLGLDGLFALWGIVLLIIGTNVLMSKGWIKSLSTTVISLGLVAVIIASILLQLLP